MIANFLQLIEGALLPYGALGVFVASFLEEVIAPIPSALVQTGAGFLLLNQGGSLWLNLIFKIALPAALGVTLGSLAIYGAVYYLGKPFIDRFGKWLALNWRDVEEAEQRFESGRRDGLLMFILRTVPIIPSVAISAFCGLIRYSFKTYLITTFLGTLVRASVLAIVGWQAGTLYHRYAEIIGKFEFLGLLAVAMAFLIFIVYRRRQSKVAMVE